MFSYWIVFHGSSRIDVLRYHMTKTLFAAEHLSRSMVHDKKTNEAEVAEEPISVRMTSRLTSVKLPHVSRHAWATCYLLLATCVLWISLLISILQMVCIIIISYDLKLYHVYMDALMRTIRTGTSTCNLWNNMNHRINKIVLTTKIYRSQKRDMPQRNKRAKEKRQSWATIGAGAAEGVGAGMTADWASVHSRPRLLSRHSLAKRPGG